MKKNIKTLILCGGKGKRLGRIGRKIPKSLVIINNKPILYYILNNLVKFNLKEIIISGFYKVNFIKRYIYSSIFSDIEIKNDGEITIAKRIINNFDNCEYLIVCYGDEIADINYNKLINSHIKSKKLLTVTTFPMRLPFGLFFNKNKSHYFEEKPLIGNINIGFMVFSKKSLGVLKRYKKIENFIKYMAEKNLLNEFVHKKNRITVNTMEELEIANKNIIKF